MKSQLINIIGLIINITGVIILYFYGMPPKYNEGYVETISDKDYKKSKKCSRVALLLVIIGFLLQLVSSIQQI